MESTLSISFPVRMSNDNSGFTYVSHDNLQASVYAGSMNTAKAKLRPIVQSTINAALLQVDNYRQHFIGCVNGTVLIVQFRHGRWGYEITGPNRAHSSGVICGDGDTYNDAVESARTHADSSYDGVAWEC